MASLPDFRRKWHLGKRPREGRSPPRSAPARDLCPRRCSHRGRLREGVPSILQAIVFFDGSRLQQGYRYLEWDGARWTFDSGLGHERFCAHHQSLLALPPEVPELVADDVSGLLKWPTNDPRDEPAEVAAGVNGLAGYLGDLLNCLGLFIAHALLLPLTTSRAALAKC